MAGEAKRGRQEDVGAGAALDEVSRQIESAGSAAPLQHPLGRRGAMVHVSGVDVRARAEKQIDDLT